MPASKTKNVIKQPYERIVFASDDIDVMDLALDHIPELRICAGIVKEARSKKLKYPIKSTQALIKLLPKKRLFVEGHHIRVALIERYMRKEYLPITNERELVARCYLAFMRCKDDTLWAARAPDNASSLLKEFSSITRTKGVG